MEEYKLIAEAIVKSNAKELLKEVDGRFSTKIIERIKLIEEESWTCPICGSTMSKSLKQYHIEKEVNDLHKALRILNQS